MLELSYSAHTASGGLFSDKVSLLPNCTSGGGSCIFVMKSFEVVVPVGVSLDVL